MRGAGSSRAVRWARAVRWYLRELTGEADYDRYLARHAVRHPGEPALTRREFDRRRWALQAQRPGSRCC